MARANGSNIANFYQISDILGYKLQPSLKLLVLNQLIPYFRNFQ